MTAFGAFLKAVLIPAIIALVLYVLLSFLVLPFVRRHRQRYSQYLPVDGSMNYISQGAVSLQQRVMDALLTLFVPSTRWRRQHTVVDGSRDARGSEDVMFDDEEGEDMIGFEIDERRREALERQRNNAGDHNRRLSRDLEEGFRDDSEDEDINRSTRR